MTQEEVGRHDPLVSFRSRTTNRTEDVEISDAHEQYREILDIIKINAKLNKK